jgi:hypothetical protein
MTLVAGMFVLAAGAKLGGEPAGLTLGGTVAVLVLFVWQLLRATRFWNMSLDEQLDS